MGFVMAFDAIYALSISQRTAALSLLEWAIIAILAIGSIIGFVISYAPSDISFSKLSKKEH